MLSGGSIKTTRRSNSTNIFFQNLSFNIQIKSYLNEIVNIIIISKSRYSLFKYVVSVVLRNNIIHYLNNA